jgi:gliding motility-associated-like protein
MKHIYIYIYILVTLSISGVSQNLVPNGSFDTTATCTNGWGFFNTELMPWCELSGGGADRFNTCNVTLFGGSPYSAQNRFQYPRSGSGFCSVIFYDDSPLKWRGYIKVLLRQTLALNKKYIVKFYANLDDDSQFAIDKLGALLTNTIIACGSHSYTPYLANPQIKNKNGVLTDTLNWVEICDTMTAIGNENSIIIGNFYSDANTNVVKAYPNAWRTLCYYNIDDVSVEELTQASCQNDTSICVGDSVLLGNNKTETATYNWQPNAGLSCSFCANPKAAPSATTKYILTKQNCNIITKDSVTITIKKDCNPTFDIPNVFTPNGDGINDTFNFSIVGASDVCFNIYNRWGNLIQTTTLQQQTTILWDGRTTSGVECSEGVYFYTLQYTDANGDVHKKNGYVSLFR